MDAVRGLARFHSRAAAALGIRGASAAISYLLVVVLARTMAPSEYGWYAIGVSAASIAGLSSALGQPFAILRFWPEYLGKGEPAYALGALRWGVRVSLVAGLSGAALAATAALLLAAIGSRADTSVLLMIAFLVPVIGQAEFWSGALRSLGSVYAALLPKELLWRLAMVAVPVCYGIFGFALTGAEALGWSGAILLALVLWQALQCQARIPIDLRGVEPKADIRKWRSVSLGIWAVNSLSAVLLQVDPLIVGALLTSTQAGHFYAAVRTASLLTLPLTAVNLVAAPQMSARYHSGDRAGVQDLCRSTLRTIAIPTGLGLMIFLVFSHRIMGTFGAGFSEIDFGFRVIAIGTAVNAFCGPVGMLMLMTGRERPYLLLLLATAALSLVTEVAGIRFLGIDGAAIANATTQIVWNVGLCIYIYRKMGVDASVLALVRTSA